MAVYPSAKNSKSNLAYPSTNQSRVLWPESSSYSSGSVFALDSEAGRRQRQLQILLRFRETQVMAPDSLKLVENVSDLCVRHMGSGADFLVTTGHKPAHFLAS